MASESPEPDSGSMPCSVCLEIVADLGQRSIAELKCGHRFHLDCIGSAFNAKGIMQCPNCRQVEDGQWLYANGCRQQEDFSLEDFIYNNGDDLFSGVSEILFPHEDTNLPSWQWCPDESSYPHLIVFESREAVDDGRRHMHSFPHGVGWFQPNANSMASSTFISENVASLGGLHPHGRSIRFHPGMERNQGHTNHFSSHSGQPGGYHHISENVASLGGLHPHGRSTRFRPGMERNQGHTSHFSSHSGQPGLQVVSEVAPDPQSSHQAQAIAIHGQAPNSQSSHYQHSRRANFRTPPSQHAFPSEVFPRSTTPGQVSMNPPMRRNSTGHFPPSEVSMPRWGPPHPPPPSIFFSAHDMMMQQSQGGPHRPPLVGHHFHSRFQRPSPSSSSSSFPLYTSGFGRGEMHPDSSNGSLHTPPFRHSR